MAWCRRICCCAFRDFCHKGDICCEKNWRFFSARFPCSCRPARPNAAITADYGESAASFTLDCVFSPETGASVTVTEPESIAGIQAQVKDTAASVSYDGMQLGLGSLADGNLAPLAAPYVLGQCWAGEYIDATGTEDGLLRTTYRMGYEEKELVVDTWFSQEPLTPVRAELSFEGRMVLRTDISAFSMRQPTQLTEE